MREKRSLKFRFEDSVFGDVFGDGVGVSANGWFWANAPGDGGMITEKFDIEFCGVIVNFSLDSGGGEKGRRGRGPGPGEDFQV